MVVSTLDLISMDETILQPGLLVETQVSVLMHGKPPFPNYEGFSYLTGSFTGTSSDLELSAVDLDVAVFTVLQRIFCSMHTIVQFSIATYKRSYFAFNIWCTCLHSQNLTYLDDTSWTWVLGACWEQLDASLVE